MNQTEIEPSNIKNTRRFDGLAIITTIGLALIFRIPGLTTFLTADEARSWFGRSLIFLTSLIQADFANTGPGGEIASIDGVSLSPAPGVTTMWTGALGILLEYFRQGRPGTLANFVATIPFDPLDPAMLLSLRLPNVLITAVAVGLTYWWSRSLLGRWGALLVAVLVALDPFYLALSRVLGHDALVTTFMWLSLLAFLRVVHSILEMPTRDKVQTQFLIISGSLAGLAFLSKYPALFIGAFVTLAILMVHLRQQDTLQQALQRWFWDMVIWSAAAGMIFVLFWPAMWVNPLGPVTAIVNDALRASGSSHQKGSFFFGSPVADPGIGFYPLIILFRTTPIMLLGGILGLFFVLFRSRPNSTQNASALRVTPLLILLGYIILYTLLVTYGGKKQDRYILPAFPALMMLATFGYIYLIGVKASWRRFVGIVTITLVLIQIAFVWPTYPYYFSYYNPIVGGGAAASDVVQVGWGEGLDAAADYLNELPEAENTDVVSWYSTTFEPYYGGNAIYKLEDEKISRSAKPGLAADYVVLYVNQVQRELPTLGALQYFQSQPPVHTVTLQGIEYAWIYDSVGMEHVIPTEVRLVGQAELLGYNVTTEAGEPTTQTVPESVLLVSLFWEWQGKAEDEPISLSLINEAGETMGWGNRIETIAPLPFAEWQEGMIVRDDFALVIFPDTPPGTYNLAAWIERPATGETVGVFPIAEKAPIQIVPREQ